MAEELKTIETVDTSPFKHLVMTLGELPTSFVDSMTYYECLAWLVNFIQNTVIPIVNNNAEAVEELQKAFVTLKNYVDTYFDNLDVQAEIDHKLDEMVEDGTLQEIIASYIQANVAWAFNTVADMKASTNLINGSYAQTYGFYSLNDGGGAFYTIHTKGAGETADEMYKIAIGDSLIAELIIGSELHSKQLGLKGDGVTDETTKLNAFLDTPSYYKRVLDNGIYVCSSTVYIKGYWNQTTGNNGIRPVIFNSATLHYTGTANNAIVVCYTHFKSSIEGLCITRNSTRGYVELVGCWHLNCKDWDIYDLKITNSMDNLSGKTTATTSNEYIDFTTCYIKGKLSIPTLSGSYSNCINFYNSLIGSGDVDYCVEISGANSHQEINFLFSDLSYATNGIFNVVDPQTGKGSVTLYSCYLDSGIPIFKDENKNGLYFNNLYSIHVANGNGEITNIKYTDFLQSTNITTFGNRGSNYAGGDVNYAINGDLSYTAGDSGHNSKWYGPTNANWTKTYETSALNKNGKCRKLLYTGSGASSSFAFDSVALPRTDIYIAFIRLRVVSGGYSTLQFSTNGKYITYTSAQCGHDEVVLCNAKELKYNANGTCSTTVYVNGIDTSEEDFIIEIYEVGILEGTVAKFGLPIASTAVLS